MKRLSLLAFTFAGAATLAMPELDARSPGIAVAPLQQEIGIVLRGASGAKPRLAVPEFVPAPGSAADLQQATKTLSEVLWDDLDFENEFYLLPRADAAKVPGASGPESLAYDQWSTLGIDGVLLGTVRATATGIEVQMRLIGVRGDVARKQLFGKTYSGCTLRNPRYCAHYLSDDFYKEQRGLDGVARTKLAFTSDRNNVLVAGRFSGNASKEIYIADYDGANQQPVTANKSINISPSWSPDGRSIAYSSWVSHFQDVYVQSFAEVKLTKPAGGTDVVQNLLPAWSPDGTKLAFTSTRDGNSELYVINRDGSNRLRLTSSPVGMNTAAAWAPSGAQIVFVSGRSGDAQLYTIGADGTGLERLNCGEPHCDHPTWAPVGNKIAYTCGVNAGYDICVLDMTTGRSVRLTDGVGTNEQPSFAPNGRHIVFVTTRWGKQHLAMVDLTGNVLKRHVTEIGNNTYPSWSRAPQ
jgi:TolB protein